MVLKNPRTATNRATAEGPAENVGNDETKRPAEKIGNDEIPILCNILRLQNKRNYVKCNLYESYAFQKTYG